jgi:hypothetical protein
MLPNKIFSYCPLVLALLSVSSISNAAPMEVGTGNNGLMDITTSGRHASDGQQDHQSPTTAPSTVQQHKSSNDKAIDYSAMYEKPSGDYMRHHVSYLGPNGPKDPNIPKWEKQEARPQKKESFSKKAAARSCEYTFWQWLTWSSR